MNSNLSQCCCIRLLSVSASFTSSRCPRAMTVCCRAALTHSHGPWPLTMTPSIGQQKTGLKYATCRVGAARQGSSSLQFVPSTHSTCHAGTVKQTLPFDDQSGGPVILDCNRDYLAASTANHSLRVFKVAGRESKPHQGPGEASSCALLDLKSRCISIPERSRLFCTCRHSAAARCRWPSASQGRPAACE